MAGTINNVQISGYDDTATYTKYDVVFVTTGTYPTYFVSTITGNSGQMNTGYISNSGWKRFDDPDFNFSTVWTPTYQTSLTLELKGKLATYGDGYVQAAEASVFGNRLSYEVTFNTIPNIELKSLVSFFEYKGGSDFVKMDVPPFITGRKFVGKNWKHVYNSDNINDFSVSMFEFISDSNV